MKQVIAERKGVLLLALNTNQTLSGQWYNSPPPDGDVISSLAERGKIYGGVGSYKRKENESFGQWVTRFSTENPDPTGVTQAVHNVRVMNLNDKSGLVGDVIFYDQTALELFDSGEFQFGLRISYLSGAADGKAEIDAIYGFELVETAETWHRLYGNETDEWKNIPSNMSWFDS